MGLDLNLGGYLIYGLLVNMLGKWFNVVSYGVCQQDQLLDMEDVCVKVLVNKFKLIVVGGIVYSCVWDWVVFCVIVDEVGVYLMVDMVYIVGLVVGGQYFLLLLYVYVVIIIMYKLLCGLCGGMVLMNDVDIVKKINLVVFFGLQGGLLMYVIVVKVVVFGEVLCFDFKDYVVQVVKNV